MKQIFKVSPPRIKVSFKFRGLLTLVAIFGMPHLVPKVTEHRTGFSNRAIYADSNTLDPAIPFNMFTHAAMRKDFGENGINPLNKVWGYPQPAAFWLDLGFKESLNNFVEFLVGHFSKSNYSGRGSKRLIVECGMEGTRDGTLTW